MANSESPGGPPTFEGIFHGEDVEQRIFGTILQTRTPARASAIADQAECDPKTARKYLDWFAELGIVVCYEGRPATYERNDAYFEWRRTNQIAADYSIEEIKERVRTLTERINDYEKRYDAETPANVDAVATAEARDDQTIDDIYRDLGDWATDRAERLHYERARQQRLGAEVEQVSG